MKQISHLLISVLLLAACGGQQSAEITSELTTADCEAGQRLFDHEFLLHDPVCIPEEPQRIVMGTPANITALLRADTPIIGMIDRETVMGVFPEWEAELVEITDVGRPLNLEVLLSLEPDLIIAGNFFELDLEALNAIAPTVVYEVRGNQLYREYAEFVFDAAGKMAALEALTIEQENRTTELRELLGDTTAQDISLVLPRPDQVILMTQYSPSGIILHELGFGRPEGQLYPFTLEEVEADQDRHSGAHVITVSLEQLDRADGDFVILWGTISNYDTEEEIQAAISELSESPLWQTLDATQEGQVYVSSTNYALPDIANDHYILSDLAEAFGVADAFSPNPYVVKTDMSAVKNKGKVNDRNT